MSKKTQQGIGAHLLKTCLEMCAMDLTEVHSPTLFNKRSMQLGLTTNVAPELGDGLDLGDQIANGVTSATTSCEAQIHRARRS